MKITSIFLFSIIAFLPLSAQNYGKGMNFDDNAYKSVERKVTLMSRDYNSLPSSASLKKYCPTVGLQTGGTCVGWSSTYYARTIIEAKQNGWTDKATIDANTYAPDYTYAIIKNPTDAQCEYGSFIHEAFELQINKGVPKYKDYNVICATSIPANIYTLAAKNKIKAFARLFESDEDAPFRLQAMKKALSNGNPVVIGMKCPDSFSYAKGFWQPAENPEGSFGGHAMCVIGYDDNQYGGAFEIINSWSTQWGNEGYIWVKYSDFTDFTKYAYEPIAIPKSNPSPTAKADLSGEIRFQSDSDNDMNATYIKKTGSLGYYKMNEAYSSGTRFRLYISNNEPAFVYAFGSDLTDEIFTIFPHKEGISAALNYASNNVALPDESHWIRMNETTGKDYLCVLYSKEPLDIESIKSQVGQQSGTFAEKVNKALASKLVVAVNTQYSANQIQFKAKSAGKSVVAVVVETTHN
jgi:hypothetical protein